MLAPACYALLVAAWIVDLFTPQLFVAAILLNGPIALSSLALNRNLTARLVVLAELANLVSGYVNGVQAGFHWDGIAIGDRLLSAASFVLVGYLSIKTQDYARQAGESAGRARQAAVERALREATGRVRTSLNVDLVLRGILRESAALLGSTSALLVVRDSGFATPLVLSLPQAGADIDIQRRALSNDIASLVARARAAAEPVLVTEDDALGRLALSSLGARAAMVAVMVAGDDVEHGLIECTAASDGFAGGAAPAFAAFSEQARTALDQAYLFRRLGQQNEEIARQKDELARRGDVIRDIVYALAHDLRTPLVAADVTMKQALAGAYGPLPPAYEPILRAAIASNDDERRTLETLLLVARYEAGEESRVVEPFDCCDAVRRAAAELDAVARAKDVALVLNLPEEPLGAAGDAGEIKRAIVNLAANAIEATPGGGAVTLVGRSAGEFVEILVEDLGYGVPHERRAHLFERFNAALPGAGTGLGLYIVRRIAEKHGGSVTYRPREPRGSVFALSLPKAVA